MKTEKIYDSKLEVELEMLIGENAQDNWDIIDKAESFDLWFHLDDHPSCHIILKLPDKHSKCNKQTLFHCASICKQKSKLKNEKKVSVIYTQRSNITKGDKPGMVYTNKTNKLTI